ncbi:MAG: PP2C family serine/threonine-protein phosphatase [Syntrophobacteraceae bacterium]
MTAESATHQGLIRENNEDRYLVQPLENGSTLLALADGMGGHAGGEVAAELALQSLAKVGAASADPIRELLDALHDAQRFILEASRFDRSLRGMGTTLTAVVISGAAAFWMHAGDTRLYLFRQGVLHQITDDHTIPGMLLKKGEISREEARLHPYGNVLTKCIGCERFEPDTGTFEVRPQDLIMLSSDGLHDLIADSDVAAILSLDIGLKEKLDRLIEKGLSAGGRDNITAILAGI